MFSKVNSPILVIIMLNVLILWTTHVYQKQPFMRRREYDIKSHVIQLDIQNHFGQQHLWQKFLKYKILLKLQSIVNSYEII